MWQTKCTIDKVNDDVDIKIIFKKLFVIVGSQIVAHTLIETGNGPNKPNTINL